MLTKTRTLSSTSLPVLRRASREKFDPLVFMFEDQNRGVKAEIDTQDQDSVALEEVRVSDLVLDNGLSPTEQTTRSFRSKHKGLDRIRALKTKETILLDVGFFYSLWTNRRLLAGLLGDLPKPADPHMCNVIVFDGTLFRSLRSSLDSLFVLGLSLDSDGSPRWFSLGVNFSGSSNQFSATVAKKTE